MKIPVIFIRTKSVVPINQVNRVRNDSFAEFNIQSGQSYLSLTFYINKFPDGLCGHCRPLTTWLSFHQSMPINKKYLNTNNIKSKH